MTSSSPYADRHRRTRRDHATETAEDYVEAIADIHSDHGKCRLVDLAQRFDVSHVTVAKIVARLKREGLVVAERYRPLKLTESGQRLAVAAKQRHEIVVHFLLAAGVDADVAEIDAEGIEHHVSHQTLERLKVVTARLVRDPL